MNLFYSDIIEGGSVVLTGDNFRHVVQVLRKRVGDRIHFTDGKGTIFETQLNSIDKKAAEAKILASHQQDKPNYLSIAAAPTKSISRYEWFLEKTTEIGIDSFLPFTSQNSERKIVKTERLKKVIVAAMKQCHQSWLPNLHPLATFQDLIINSGSYKKKYIAYVDEQPLFLPQHLKHEDKVLIMIGPEGGFTKDELALSVDNGFKSISLGPNRLRAETAGVVACSQFNWIIQQNNL